MKTRREFLQTSALAAGAAAVGAADARALGAASRSTTPEDDDGRPASRRSALDILVLGGTGFIGPHTIREALGRGHTVSMFNRGRTNPHLFPNIRRYVGDRNDDLSALEGGSWDVVLDLPATNPDWVTLSANLLKDAANQYLYISSLSAYSDTSVVGVHEDSPVFQRETTELGPDGRLPYGLAKALSEQEARNAFGDDRATIVRPGLIVGPGDPTDRFTYWPVRIDRGGEVMAPGDGTDPAQIIDARDLAKFLIDLVEAGTAGDFNAVGPESRMSMAEMLYGIRAVTTGPVSFTWVPWEFMESREVRPWADMPVWVPMRPETVGFSAFSNQKALRHGIAFRPLAETAADTISWHKTRPAEQQERMRSGLTAEREAELLREWHAENG